MLVGDDIDNYEEIENATNLLNEFDIIEVVDHTTAISFSYTINRIIFFSLFNITIQLINSTITKSVIGQVCIIL